MARAQHQRALAGGVLRVSRPVVLGQGHAADGRCVGCHTGLMNIERGEVVGRLGHPSSVGRVGGHEGRREGGGHVARGE